MKKFIIILLGLTFYLQPSAETIRVTDFGAVPDDGKDDSESLRAAAAFCRTHPGTTLDFAPGIYDFYDEDANRIEREAISGAYGPSDMSAQYFLFRPDAPYVKGLDFTGATGLTVNGNGAVLKMHGWFENITLDKVKDAKITGLTMTNARPAATSGKVIKSGKDYFDIRLDPDCIYLDSIVTGRFIYYDPARQQIYTRRTGKKYMLDSLTMRVESQNPVAAGHFAMLRHGGHYRGAVFIREAENVTLENIKILSFAGMGILGHRSKDILIDGLQVMPMPGRYSSTNTDATHFTSCSGNITIRNSTFRGNGDDCTNIHNYYYTIYPEGKKKARLAVEGADLHALSLDPPEPGDTMALISRRNMADVAHFTVDEVETDEKEWRVSVTFREPIDKYDASEFYMQNLTRVPHVEIVNNTVGSHLGRSFLIKTPTAHIARNTIYNSSMTAIKLGGELSWHESGPVHDVVIEDNVIYNCSRDNGPSEASCIMTSTESPETPPQANRNIVIRNNIFVTDKPTAILLQDARDVVIENNFINSDNYVKQINCSNVTIR